ncbi:hypothetical protein BP00DRAFT_449650 [Aspergillus indologenus CBS 114.80]|uniref:Uncharacterized protein n=1 Tax=Aspergillus indologenus CBS 114.80 TaxID=1450541 RepID=A0A2V5I1N0_9EURO|nr:hypothetical protein BP00DRAFT_449650 [Aspergillus indologenus CBS 114.80]
MSENTQSRRARPSSDHIAEILAEHPVQVPSREEIIRRYLTRAPDRHDLDNMLREDFCLAWPFDHHNLLEVVDDHETWTVLIDLIKQLLDFRECAHERGSPPEVYADIAAMLHTIFTTLPLALGSVKTVPRFSKCCMEGDVELPPVRTPPALLRDLFARTDTDGPQFLASIRHYNGALCFTSANYHIDRRTARELAISDVLDHAPLGVKYAESGAREVWHSWWPTDTIRAIMEDGSFDNALLDKPPREIMQHQQQEQEEEMPDVFHGAY